MDVPFTKAKMYTFMSSRVNLPANRRTVFGIVSLLLLAVLLLILRTSSIDRHSVTATHSFTGKVVFDNGEPVRGAAIRVSFSPLALSFGISDRQKANNHSPYSVETVTDSDGTFTSAISATLPLRMMVEVKYHASSLPTVSSAKVVTVENNGPTALVITLPNPLDAEIPLSEGAGRNSDGALEVAHLPVTVKHFYGRSYDPDHNRSAFPGDFTEQHRFPLNSSLFVWLEALDAQGNPVDRLSQPALLRSRIPITQWVDLEDIRSGTDRIELPLYTYNESLNQWQQMGEGWLEDGNHTVMPEDAQSVILNGSFDGQLFATFTTTHFSWMNVDYPHIGPWTLHRLGGEQRNDDCFYQAATLAQTIFRTQWANQAYQATNQPGITLNEAVGDATAPEIKSYNATGDMTYGEVRLGDFRENLYLNNNLWTACNTYPNESRLLLAVTLLHETAHWLHDAKKHNDAAADESDVGGEAGIYVEEHLFGGPIWSANGTLPVGAEGLLIHINDHDQPITQQQLGKLIDPHWWQTNDTNFSSQFWRDFWHATNDNSGNTGGSHSDDAGASSPLQLSLQPTQQSFELGSPIVLTVHYANVTDQPIRVLNTTRLPGNPLSFQIQATDGTLVAFIGPKVKYAIQPSDFVILAPGETLQQTLDLTFDAVRLLPRYNFVRSGTYAVRLLYTAGYGLPLTQSEPIFIHVGAGGRLNGLVTDATTAQPIADATVSVFKQEIPIDKATTDSDGNYNFPELPAGVYTVEIHATGRLHTTRSNISIQKGESTTINASLSPFLANGALRMVLTWGESPVDLDAHLWLPASMPVHISFTNHGALTACPFATLDADSMNGFGPETITIARRYPSGSYLYAVHNYNQSPDLSRSQAQVQLFDASGLLATFSVPTQGIGSWWVVFRLDGETGRIAEVNRLQEESPQLEWNLDDCSSTS